MNLQERTADGDLLSDLSPRAKSLLEKMNTARAKCRMLQTERAELEAKIMNALAEAAEAQTAYYTCLSVDDSQKAELARRDK